MNWSNLFFLYLDIAVGYGEGQNRTICGLKNWGFALWSKFASLSFLLWYVMPNVVRLRPWLHETGTNSDRYDFRSVSIQMLPTVYMKPVWKIFLYRFHSFRLLNRHEWLGPVWSRTKEPCKHELIWDRSESVRDHCFEHAQECCWTIPRWRITGKRLKKIKLVGFLGIPWLRNCLKPDLCKLRKQPFKNKIHQFLLAVLGNEDDYVDVSTLMLKITNYH